MASVAACPGLLALIAAVILVGASFGWHPLWSEPALNLAEAAALKDLGTIQRLIWDGADPNAPVRVRAGILHDDEMVLTPLEASVGTRTPLAMQFLLANGARMDERGRTVLLCLAIKDDAHEIVDALVGAAGEPDCDGVATPW